MYMQELMLDRRSDKKLILGGMLRCDTAVDVSLVAEVNEAKAK